MTKQICLTLYLGNCTSYDCGFWYTHVKCHRVYFETFLRDGTQYIDKVCIGQFYPEILFQQNCGIWAQFGPKSYSLMIHSQLCLMIHSLEIFKYGMIGCYSYTKEAIIFSLWARAIWAEFGPKLCNIMCHDSFSEDLFDVLCHDKAQCRQAKEALVIFPKFRIILS